MMRLYICAAAKDMAAERELLHTYVLPELNDRLAEHGLQVAFDDPRAADDYLSLSADERLTEALDRIDRARPWFIALVGDAVDDAPIALPADVLARHPWLSQHPGASVVELELAYGALEAGGPRKPIVYFRDDRFLRDVPLDQRSDFSSDDLEAVGRLETLKGQIREAGVQLVDGYHCRWDGAADRVNDLDELGKQIVEDLYEAILQAEHPEMQIGVLDEVPASGAAMGMVNQAADGSRSTGSSDADDDLNFDMEDILDVDAGLKDSSSASAIEGVEPLDFLDDGPPAAPMSAMEPTINYNPNSDVDDDIGFDLADEVLDVEDVEVADISPVADDAVDVDVEGMFAEAEPLTDLSDMVDEAPPAAESVDELSPWGDEMEAPLAEDAPPAMALPIDQGREDVDDWLAEPVAEAEEIPAAEPVAELFAEESLADEPPMAEPFFDDAAPAEIAEPLADDEAFLGEPLAEAPPASATHGFDTTLAWSPGTAEEAADEPIAEAGLWGDDNQDSPDEEMEIDLVDGDEPVAEVSDAPLFDDDDDAAVAEPQAEDEVNHIPLTFGEPVNADESVAEAAAHADDDGLDMFLDLPEEADAAEADELERTVRHNSEATEISDFGDEPVPEAVAEAEDEFRLQEEPAPVALAAPAVASSYVPSPKQKKKSSLPLILAALALLLIVGGGAGAYFAGLIPGLGGKPTDVAVNPPTTPTNPAANDVLARINENTKKLTDLFNSAKSPTGEIDGAKVQEAQALLASLETSDPEVAAEEPIQAMKPRFAQLATDFAKQANDKVETKRQEDFRAALELAGASAPMSLEQSYLDEAKRLATSDDERNLIAALEGQVADYAAEQERLAAEAASGGKQAEAIAAIAAAVGDAENYRAAVEAFVTEYPEDRAAADWKASLESEPATLDAVAALNKVAADWSKLDMRKLPAADAQQQLDAAKAALACTAALPGGAEIAARIEQLKPMAQRTTPPQFAGGAIQAPFVLSMKDGRRYYMAAAPAKKDGKLIATYVSDLGDPGATADAEIVPADIDRANSGPSPVAAAAKVVNDALATADAAWEPAFIKALMSVQADAKLDPVVKQQWLLRLANIGSQGSEPLSASLADFASLNVAGVDASFNWADPAAALEAREKCSAALAALPQVRSLAPAIAKSFNSLASLNTPAPLVPVGVLVKNAEDAWTVQLAEGAPASGSLTVLASDANDAPLSATNVGTIEAGEAVINETAEKSGWTQGRVVYAMSATEVPAGN